MRVTKYSDNEFALRLSYNEAISLLALFVTCRPEGEPPEPKDAELLFPKEAREALFEALDLEGDKELLRHYPYACYGTGRTLREGLCLHPDAAEAFLRHEEEAESA